jgi:hypothetical protein
MHVLQPELSVLDDAVSYYMNGSGGRILSLGLSLSVPVRLN